MFDCWELCKVLKVFERDLVRGIRGLCYDFVGERASGKRRRDRVKKSLRICATQGESG